MIDNEFDRILADAKAAPFEGWDFSWIEGRLIEQAPSWDLGDLLRARFPQTSRLLDMGTGGGEFLSSLAPLPPLTVATEAYRPNFTVANGRLSPFGAKVVAVEGAPDNDEWVGEGGRLPFRAASFDLVMSRHEAYSPTEIARVLESGGYFLTEQLGGNSGHEAEFRRLFGREPGGSDWDLAKAARQIEQAGLTMVRGGEEFPISRFMDIGALAYYLLAVPWVIENFDISHDRLRLERLHHRILRDGFLEVPGHLYWLEARKPVS